jgi:hypothetical protein
LDVLEFIKMGLERVVGRLGAVDRLVELRHQYLLKKINPDSGGLRRLAGDPVECSGIVDKGHEDAGPDVGPVR